MGGDHIKTNNPVVGFQLSDINDNILFPNNGTSVIPFQLNSSSKATVSLKAWPINITGGQPDPGPVNAEGFLRIDFQ